MSLKPGGLGGVSSDGSATSRKGNSSSLSLVDKVKAKATLVKLLEPVSLGISAALLNRTEMTDAATGIARSVAEGDLGGVSGNANRLARGLYQADGAAGTVVKGALALSSGVSVGVAVTELAVGMNTKNKFLVTMGLLDLLGASTRPLLMIGFGAPAIGVALTVAAAKGVLVFSPSKDATEIQKADTLFSMVGAGASTAMKAGFAVLPAFLVSLTNQILQVSYMNSGSMRKKINGVLSKLSFLNPFHHREKASEKTSHPSSETGSRFRR